MKQSSNNIYTVTIINKNKDPLYDITYDLGRKKYTTKCRMPPGNVVNEIPTEVPMYDFVAKQTSANTEKMAKCYADKDYTAITLMPVSYIGYGPLIDFIESDGILTYMFDEDNGVEGARCPASIVSAVRTDYYNVALSGSSNTQLQTLHTGNTERDARIDELKLEIALAASSSSQVLPEARVISCPTVATAAIPTIANPPIDGLTFRVFPQSGSGTNPIVDSRDRTKVTCTGNGISSCWFILKTNINVANATIIIHSGGGGGGAGKYLGGGGGGAGTRREITGIRFSAGTEYEFRITTGGLGGNVIGNYLTESSLNIRGQNGQSVRFIADNYSSVQIVEGGSGGEGNNENDARTSAIFGGNGGRSADNKEGGISSQGGGGGGSTSNNGNSANVVSDGSPHGGSGGDTTDAYGAGGGGGAGNIRSLGGRGGYISTGTPETKKGGGDGGDLNQNGKDATELACGGGGGGSSDPISGGYRSGGKGSNATIEIRIPSPSQTS